MPAAFQSNAFQNNAFETPEEAAIVVQGVIGYLVPLKPYRGPGYRKRGHKEEIELRRQWWEERQQREYRFNNPQVIQIIERIAQRQIEDLTVDEEKRFEELERELEVKGIEWEGRYLEALNARREHLIEAEISDLLRAKMDEQEAMFLIVLAAHI